jgi:formate-dependent nitrite reductase membrane component NrfD
MKKEGLFARVGVGFLAYRLERASEPKAHEILVLEKWGVICVFASHFLFAVEAQSVGFHFDEYV